MLAMEKIRPNALVIIKKDGNLLAARGEDKVTGKVFYRLMGGGIEFGELSSGTIKREIREELNATVINEKFLCPIENIFEFNSKKGHEITFLYEGDIEEKSFYDEKRIKVIDKEDSFAEWVPIENIKNGETILYPQETVKYL